ncbi:MAG: right-handed parallel beta-helix repeat-containing protein, partial [Chloroflexi bacterium]|nr:right-handed parallel beta-helix repeat-containing protein [Chloroflexota bacterium]
SNTTPQGACSGACNLISGNGGTGLAISGAAANTLVQGNFIGTNASGTGSVPNTGNGLSIASSTQTVTVGGSSLDTRNLISGNGTNGVRLSAASQATIKGNVIGRGSNGAALGNTQHGVRIENVSTLNTIGGSNATDGNAIAHNGGDGVAVLDTSHNNRIQSNTIAANTGLGLDLDDDGVTANDAGDGDAGPNNRQNFPVLTSATTTGTSITIVGTLSSTASTAYTIQLFANAAADPSGHGEGETFLGQTTTTTDASGTAAFTATLTAIAPAGQIITATAIDPDGDTSEFSAGVTATGSGSAGSIQFSSASYTVNENAGTATITVTRTGGSTGPVSVNYATSNGTATGTGIGTPEDYFSQSGVLNFPDGQTTAQFAVSIVDDTLVEGNETINLTLSNPTGGATLGTPSTAVVTIVDNDRTTGGGGDGGGDSGGGGGGGGGSTPPPPPPATVTLTASPSQVPTRGSVTVSWSALSPSGNDWISLHAAGAASAPVLSFKTISGSTGSVTFEGFDRPGVYEFRLYRNGSLVATSNTVGVAALTAGPTQVTFGGDVSVSWQGLVPGGNDRISLHAAGNPSAPALNTQQISAASGSVIFRGFNAPGTYEFRLYRGGTLVATSNPIGLAKLTASPTGVLLGGVVTATWIGLSPSGNDWISLHKAGTPGAPALSFERVSRADATITMSAPAAVGDYELRLYRNGALIATSNRFSIASLSTKADYMQAGDNFLVSFTNFRSGSAGNLVGVFRLGEPDSSPIPGTTQSTTSFGASFFIAAPASPGTYEVRLLADNRAVAVSKPIKVAKFYTETGRPKNAAGRPVARPGALVVAVWEGYTPGSNDWISLHPVDGSNRLLDWKPIRAGGYSLAVFTAPRERGTNELRLFQNGTQLFSTLFDVEEEVSLSWINRAWTESPSGNVNYTFAPGDSFRLLAEIYTSGTTRPAQLTWNAPLSCGSLSEGTVSFTPPVGYHTERFPLIRIPDECTGTVGFRLTYSFNGADTVRETSIRVDRSGQPNLIAGALEVTQAVQDLKNTVRLVANKRTFVRFHVRAENVSGGPGYVSTARLSVQRAGKKDVLLTPIDTGNGEFVIVSDKPDRGDVLSSFLFELPDGYKDETVLLTGILNPGPGDLAGSEHFPIERDYADNRASTSVRFERIPKQTVVLYDVRYAFNGQYYAVPPEREDELIDYLHRTFPMAAGSKGLKVIRRTYESQDWLNPVNILGRKTLPHPCINLGGDLALFRNKDLAAEKVGGERAGDIYVGIVDEGGFVADDYFSKSHVLPIPGGDQLTAVSTIPLGCGWPGSRTAAYIAGLYGPGHLPMPNWSGPTPGNDAEVGAHEIGHAYNRGHAKSPASRGRANCGSENWPVDEDFPGSGRISSVTAKDNPSARYGFDPVSYEIHAPNSYDLMSYCDNVWISRHTFEGLMDTFISFTGSALKAVFPGVNVRIARGAQAQSQAAQQSERLIVQGLLDATANKVALQPLFAVEDTGDAPEHTPGPYSVVLRGGSGAELGRYPFAPQRIHGVLSSGLPPAGASSGTQEIYAIAELVPFVAGTTHVDLEGPSGLLKRVTAGAAAPTVTLLAPAAGTTVTGDELTVTWKASDADGDPLSYKVEYSVDDGKTWRLLQQHLTAESAQIPVAGLTDSASARVRVLASDGIHTTSAVSGAFSVPKRPPTVRIKRGGLKATVVAGQTVNLEGVAYDASGDLEEAQVQWSSSLDGALGEGSQVSTAALSVGEHVITLSADNGTGTVATDSVPIRVVASANDLPPNPDGLRAGPRQLSFDATTNQMDATVTIYNNELKSAIRWEAAASASWVQLSASAGTTPNRIVATVNAAGLPTGVHTATITL